MVCRGLLNASEIPPKSGAPGAGRGPRVDQRRDAHERQSRGRAGARRRADQLAGQVAVARVGVGNQVHAGLVQMLAESFVIGEHEGLVLLDRAAQRRRRTGCARKPGAEAPSKKLRASRALLRRNSNSDPCNWFVPDWVTISTCAAGTLAVLRAVGIAQHVEFPHRVHAQQLLAGAARLHVVLRRAREFHAVQQEQILLRPVSRHGEIVADGRIRNADAAGLLPGEIDHAGIQREQFVVTAPVERKILDLLFADQARRCPRWSRSTSGASPFTVTCWLDSPTCRLRSTVALWPTTR